MTFFWTTYFKNCWNNSLAIFLGLRTEFECMQIRGAEVWHGLDIHNSGQHVKVFLLDTHGKNLPSCYIRFPVLMSCGRRDPWIHQTSVHTWNKSLPWMWRGMSRYRPSQHSDKCHIRLIKHELKSIFVLEVQKFMNFNNFFH